MSCVYATSYRIGKKIFYHRDKRKEIVNFFMTAMTSEDLLKIIKDNIFLSIMKSYWNQDKPSKKT